jgi:hypothetical protein
MAPPRKYELASRRLSQYLDDREGLRRQRHAVFTAGLHAVRGNRPNFRPEIEFIPARAEHFARASRRQYRELQRISRSRHASVLAKLADEFRQILVRHRSKVAAGEFAGFPRFDRVAAGPQHLAPSVAAFAGLGERGLRIGTETHFALPPLPSEQIDPRPPGVLRQVQIKPASVRMAPRFRECHRTPR